MNKTINVLGVLFRVTIASLLFILIQLAFYMGFDLAGVDVNVHKGLFSVLYGIVTVGAFLLYAFIRSYKREKLIEHRRMNLITVFCGIVLAFGLLGIVTIYLENAIRIAQSFAPMQEQIDTYNEHIDRYANVEVEAVPYWDSILEFIASCLVIPLAEELVFRGVIFGEFKTVFNPWLSALFSALVFGLLHGVSIHIGYALVCGFILAMAYHYSGSIWLTFMIHAIFNFMGSTLFTFLDSGILGDFTYATRTASIYLAVFEEICIIPAIAGYVLLRTIYKSKKEEEAKTQKINENEAKSEEVTV